MKFSVTVFLGLMLVMLVVKVSGKPATYLVETVDDASVTNYVIFNFLNIYLFKRFWDPNDLNGTM